MKRVLRGVAITLPALSLALAGCDGLKSDSTVGLFGKATHTGTASLYRADVGAETPNIEKEQSTTSANDRYGGQRGRFAALREKGDYIGLATSDRVVTADDTITLTLNGGFIKYFREEGGDTRQGEIALVLSFDGGTERAVTEEDAILIYASQGQTLGSFLDLTDWKILGPMVVDDDSLRLRIVMIEWDQQENEQRKELVRAVAATAANFVSGVGGHLTIASSLANFIVDQNRDDTIIDQRFALRRMQAGGLHTGNPLLVGTYVLMLQEDSLANTEVAGTLASLPPVINDLRFDRHSGRIYKRYDYIPGLHKLTGEQASGNGSTVNCGGPSIAASGIPDVYDLTYDAILYPGRSWLGWSRVFPQTQEFENSEWKSPQYKKCVLKNWINGETAVDWRRNVLGYREPVIGEFELWSSLDKALYAAVADGIRLPNAKTAGQTASQVVARAMRDAGFDPTNREAPRALPYNYKVAIYPKAFAVMAEYPLHTHLVFTIEHSLGGVGQPYHRQFERYLDVLEREKLRTREETRLTKLTDQIEAARRSMARQSTVFSQVDKLPREQVTARVCKLLPLLKPDETLLSAADVYNKLFHVTDEYFDDADGVAGFLTAKGCTASASDFTCDCSAPPSETAPTAANSL